MRSALKNGIDPEEFEIAKKAVYAQYALELNSVQAIGGGLIGCEFSGRELFKCIDAISALTLDEAQDMLAFLLNPDRCTLSVVKGDD